MPKQEQQHEEKQISEIEKMRHSLAHLLAAAVMELWPDTKRTIGPAIENGFYFDFEFSKPVSEQDLPKIEKRMRKLYKTWKEFERHELDAAAAKKEYPGNQYKAELIDEFTEGGKKPVSFYKSGAYWDLCRGGHVENMKDVDIDAFKLDRVAGAYWRGDERNTMLTRIYGLAFMSKQELDDYLAMREEAAKRDHRKLGKELKLFAFSDYVGPGLPLWLPNGTVLTEELEKLAKETEGAAGYQRVRTPHVAKEVMYTTSGHLPYYAESMFPPMVMQEDTGEDTTYYLKSMNCPHHHMIFAAEPRSYRDLPLRLAEYGTVYRYEKSGELFGLMRVRMLSMNDAHIYCTAEQFADEFRAVNEMYLKYFKLFGIDRYIMRFSTHEPKKLGEKYVDEPELWLKTEDMVRKAMIDTGIEFVEVPDEAAFYGPKIDVQVWSSVGREFTIATNQVDFAVPKRFGLVYVDNEGKEQTPIAIHRAPLGTHERFIGFLIEHYGGAFPVWLAPEQVRLLAVGESHRDFVKELEEKFTQAGIRASMDVSDNTVGKKIREAEKMKVPYILVIGDKEKESGNLAVRMRGQRETEEFALDQFIQRVQQEIRERKA